LTSALTHRLQIEIKLSRKKNQWHIFLWRVVFGVSPSVGVKGNSREEGAKKRIFTADGEEEGNLLYTTIYLFLFPTPCVPFSSPENDTDKKRKM